MDLQQLYQLAKDKLNPRQISKTSYAGSVAAAILSGKGNVYTGVCIDTPCSMGFCAEHSAIASMIANGESKILRVVSVYEDGTILPPCGRCREFINQIHDENKSCEVLLPNEIIKTIEQLLPDSFN